MKVKFLPFAFILLLSACVKEVFIAQPPYESRVSIQGIIETDSVPKVYFNRTVPYLTGSTNTADLVIRHAAITIEAPGQPTDVLRLDSTYDRVDCRYIYVYKGFVPSKNGLTYSLSITSDGKTYTATTVNNLKPVSIDSVSYTASFKDIYGDHEGVIVYFKALENEFYRYEMLRAIDSSARRGENKIINSCIGTDTISVLEMGRTVYDNVNIQGSQIKIVAEPSYSHFKGLEGIVRMQSIDNATYQFYNQADLQKLGQYNPFVEPYFLPDGQFGKDAVGFFGSRVHSSSVRFVFPE